MNTVQSIRREFADLWTRRDFAPGDMLEITACQFVADEPSVFGTPNEDWHQRELEWYLSMSRSVGDIPPPVPKIWEEVSSSKGEINSNYGWCIFSPENGLQFHEAIKALSRDQSTRQAVMIYNRPSMHQDATRDGMRDFMCTNNTQLLLRGGFLDYLVYMRSSDAVFGYKGDAFWHRWVHDQAVKMLQLEGIECRKGRMVWHAGSFHVYPRHHRLVAEWVEANRD